jgi:putative ABC transport system permease protein
MDDVVSASVAERRFQMNLILLLALAALLLASLGVYGLVSHSVAQRVPEIGLRMALGAQSASIRRLVLRQALQPVAAGLVVGVGGSLALARIVRGLLFGVSPTNLATFAVAASVIVVAALVASYVPVRRATRVDPIVALRSE